MSSRQELTADTPLIADVALVEADGGRVLEANLTGDLTVVNAPELLSNIRRLIEKFDVMQVRLGFADVGYVDSGALGALIEVRKTVGRRGGKVVLDYMPKELSGLIRIMKLDAVFELGSCTGPSAEEAG